jgi:hypothetical protein
MFEQRWTRNAGEKLFAKSGTRNQNKKQKTKSKTKVRSYVRPIARQQGISPR